ncbi:hypothetical protein ElyMa_006506800 [Elysia marginata]|uniref:Reverse transcriptase domain-containing protein n=1 Tax=Elysia marginata TaxID=1093978 RepID=A0AAV4I4J6_9GAST|nr:hypothetical protein ElyMa_006506800 [Elysia marginata]
MRSKTYGRSRHFTLKTVLAYADDVGFVSTTDFVVVETVQKELADFRLNVDTNKTEYTLVQKDGEDWKKVKKVGSLLGDTEDIERRKQLSNLALQKLSSIWIRNDKAINTPPNVAMTKYFKTEVSKRRGRPKTSIVTTLRRDLKSHNSDHLPTRLHSINDLDHPRDIAPNRSDWKHLTTAIYRSAQAETSVDVASDGY